MANYLTTFRGTLGAGTVGEIFSHSLPVISTAAPSAVATSMINALTARWNMAVTPLSAQFPNAVVYTEVTVASILDLTLGKVAVAYHQAFAPPLTGSGASGSMPSQNTVAVSYWSRAARPNGGDIKSRFYLPTPAKDVAAPTDGTIVSGTVDVLRDHWAAILTQITDDGHQVATWSRSLGIVVPAHDMRVGNRVDTQRRRRNAGNETYSIGQISP